MFVFPVLFSGRCSWTPLYTSRIHLATVNANTFRLQCVQRVLKPLFHRYNENRSWNRKVCQKTKTKKNLVYTHTHTSFILLTLELIEIGPLPVIWITLSDMRIIYFIILRHTVPVYNFTSFIQRQFLLERFILFLFLHNYACQLNIK